MQRFLRRWSPKPRPAGRGGCQVSSFQRSRGASMSSTILSQDQLHLLLPSSSCCWLFVVVGLSVLTMSLWSLCPLSTEWAVHARCSAQQPMVESRSLKALKLKSSKALKRIKKPRTFFHFITIFHFIDAKMPRLVSVAQCAPLPTSPVTFLTVMKS